MNESSRPSALAVVQGWSRSREHREAALFLRARRRFKDALSQGQRGSGTSPVGGLKGVVLDAESADGTAWPTGSVLSDGGSRPL